MSAGVKKHEKTKICKIICKVIYGKGSFVRARSLKF
jgi:hypothetical protein